MAGLAQAYIPDNDVEATLYFAGSCRPDPGLPTIAFVIHDHRQQRIVEEFHSCLGCFTLGSIAAHYKALITGLQHALRHKIRTIRALGHSDGVIDQINEIVGVHHVLLQRYRDTVLILGARFDEFELGYIPRQRNRYTRYLARVGFYNIFVDKSPAVQNDIRIMCANPENAVQYIKDHTGDGCHQIHFILDTMQTCGFYYTSDAIQQFMIQLKQIMPRHGWYGNGRPNRRISNNDVPCTACLINRGISNNDVPCTACLIVMS